MNRSRALAASALLAGLCVFAAQPALASSYPESTSTDSSASPDLIPPPEPGSVIECDYSADNPHDSGHVNGTVNAEATVSCTGNGKMRVISGQVTLTSQRGNNVTGSITGERLTDKDRNSFQYKPNAALSCSGRTSNTFKNSSNFTLVPPAGYSPSQITVTLIKSSGALCNPTNATTEGSQTFQVESAAAASTGSTRFTVK